MPFPLTSFMILVFSPMAAIAIIIKNLLKFFSGVNTLALTPIFAAMVVIIDAPIK